MRRAGLVITLARSLATAATILLLAQGTAHGAVVEASQFPERTIYIEAGPGEKNDLAVRRTENPDVIEIEVVENGKAPLTAGSGCSETADGVVCVARYEPIVSAEMNDQNDRFDAAGFNADELSGEVSVWVHGGDGNDRIIGSDGFDELLGDSGDDDLVGREGADVFEGGFGRDELIMGPGNDNAQDGPGRDLALGGPDGDRFETGQTGDDVLRGQGGEDLFVSYESDGEDGNDLMLGGRARDEVLVRCRTCEFSFDGVANDGRPGEADNAVVEDFLSIGPGVNRVEGDAGANRITTTRGDDKIDGKGGKDVLSAGDDDDTVRSVDGEVDAVNCGTGTDTVVADEIDVLRECETVRIPARRERR